MLSKPINLVLTPDITGGFAPFVIVANAESPTKYLKVAFQINPYDPSDLQTQATLLQANLNNVTTQLAQVNALIADLNSKTPPPPAPAILPPLV